MQQHFFVSFTSVYGDTVIITVLWSPHSAGVNPCYRFLRVGHIK